MTDSTRTPRGATGPFAPIAADAATLHIILQHIVDCMRGLYGLDATVSNRAVYTCVRDAYKEAVSPEETYPGMGHLLQSFRMIDRLHSSALISGNYPSDYEKEAHARLQLRAAEAAKRGTHLRLVEGT